MRCIHGTTCRVTSTAVRTTLRECHSFLAALASRGSPWPWQPPLSTAGLFAHSLHAHSPQENVKMHLKWVVEGHTPADGLAKNQRVCKCTACIDAAVVQGRIVDRSTAYRHTKADKTRVTLSQPGELFSSTATCIPTANPSLLCQLHPCHQLARLVQLYHRPNSPLPALYRAQCAIETVYPKILRMVRSAQR